jgi:hypothetical protein
MDPAVQEVVKAITAKYTAVELITQREKIRGEIKALLQTRLLTYNILVDDFSIVNFKFSQQFEQAIESKQTAEQLALKAQRDLERTRLKHQKVASAKAEAESCGFKRRMLRPNLSSSEKSKPVSRPSKSGMGVCPSSRAARCPLSILRIWKSNINADKAGPLPSHPGTRS